MCHPHLVLTNLQAVMLAVALSLQYCGCAQSHDSAVEVWVREVGRKEGGERQGTCIVSNITRSIHLSLPLSHLSFLLFLTVVFSPGCCQNA